MKPVKLIDLVNVPKRKYSLPGKNCNCAAHGESECGCGADWTDYATYNRAISDLESMNQKEVSEIEIQNIINLWSSKPDGVVTLNCTTKKLSQLIITYIAGLKDIK